MLLFQVEAIKVSDIPAGGTDASSGKKHTVKVTVPVSRSGSDNSGPQATACIISFTFCEYMHTVLADCDTHKGLLECICTNDKGMSWPHNAYKCGQGRELPAEGRPYMWCQRLGGLDLYLLPAVAAAGDGAVCTFTADMFIRHVKRFMVGKV